jgi:hypothetical protein
MCVHEAQAYPVKSPELHKAKHFSVAYDRGARQIAKQPKNRRAILQRSECQLADDHGVDADLRILQQVDQACLRSVKMVDPHRRIDQDHAERRWRGADAARGSLPPRPARRRELSRAMSASKPSRTNVDFDDCPVSSAAFWMSSSSRLRVVRMHGF